jgi:hypothetical protein
MVFGCQDREDLFSLHNTLITIIVPWNDMAYREIPFLVNFEEKVLFQYQDEMDMLEMILKIPQQLQDGGVALLGS